MVQGPPRSRGRSVAPADDRQRVVHHHELVVHAMVDASEVHQEKEVRPAVGEGIEQADLDVGVGVECGDARVTILG